MNNRGRCRSCRRPRAVAALLRGVKDLRIMLVAAARAAAFADTETPMRATKELPIGLRQAGRAVHGPTRW